MKPQIIRSDQLTTDQRLQVDAWLKANGCTWLVIADEHIQITGQHFTVRTLTVKNTRQAKTMWPRRLPDNWNMPTKVRKYRIRHELRLDS